MVKIYLLKDPDTNKIKYVGKTVQKLKYRLSGHISASKRRRTSYVNCWIYSLIKNNKKPIIELIEEVSQDIWEEREKFWISYYKDLCNHQIGGGHGNFGISLSKQHRKNISKSLRGKSRDKETRNKISKGHKGKKLSEETKRKLSILNKGKKYSEERKAKVYKPIAKYSKEGVFIKEYPSVKHAAIENNCLRGSISNALDQKRCKTYRGFIWRIINKK